MTRLTLARLLAAAMTALTLACTAGTIAAQTSQDIRPALATTGKPAAMWQFLNQDALPGQPKNSSFSKSQALALQLNTTDMFALKPGAEIDIALPAATYVVVFERAEQHGGGIATWVGRIKNQGNDSRVLITRGPSGAFGSIRTPAGEFRIVPGDGHDWLIDMKLEQALVPPIDLRDDMVTPPKESDTHAGSTPKFAPAPDGINAQPNATMPPQVFIDLMFVYTTGYAAKLGPNLMTRLYSLVAAANQAYIDSEVAITLRLVRATKVDYSDGTTDDVALNSLGAGTGVFSGIAGEANAAGADMLALLRDGESTAGSGLGQVSRVGMIGTLSVVTGCVYGCEWVLIHELGHNMGNVHDHATTSYRLGPAGAYPYSYGHYYCEAGLNCNPSIPGNCTSQPACATSHANNFGTIMSYFRPTVVKFSNPDILCTPPGGAARPCGIAEAEPNPANTALSMNNMRTAISGRNSTVITNLPGSLQFSKDTYDASESDGSVNFTVSRIGGSSGAIAVNYVTADGSAIAGLDYAASSGTLNWADGDTADKTISIPISNDGITEGNENFSVTLSNPTGATGVYLGSPNVAFGTILETWPAGATLPAGFTTSSSPLAWTVATDQAYEGTSSLRSAQAYNNQTSALSFTGNFNAGFISFAYRVSSYPEYGMFYFEVDGVPVKQDSNESGWQTLSAPVTAGTHTLTWRFANPLLSPCNLYTPPPAGGANCADRVWIDALSLPLAKPASTSTLVSSLNPSAGGQSLNLTATISGSTGTPVGNVIFKDGGTPIPGCTAVALASGSAVCTTAGLSVGSHAVTAQYSGNSIYASSTSAPLTQTVNLADSTTTVISSVNPSSPTQSVTFTASVAGNLGTPTGNVAFKDGASLIPGCAAVTLTAGSATCTTAGLTSGSHGVRAEYGGDASYNASTSATLTQNVSVIAASNTVLKSSVNPAGVAQAVTFTATVSGSMGTPTGSIMFKDGATAITGCSAVTLSAGSAACTTAALALGSHAISAQYSGNASYVAGTPGMLTQIVNLKPGNSSIVPSIMFLLME